MLGVLRRLRQLFGPRRTDVLAELDRPRVRLVVGLGNPGDQYAGTRHNVGFQCVDRLAERCQATWTARQDDLRSQVAIGWADDLHVVLARPQTFMNRSGEAVCALLEHLHIAHAQCLIMYDDMDLPFGAVRLRERGSPGTHNGMRSIVSSLGADDIPRLRIGIGQAQPGSATSHVLGGFTPEEGVRLDTIIEHAADAACAWAIHGAAIAMNRYNIK